MFVYPRRLPDPLTTFAAGATLSVLGRSGEWYRVEFRDPRWGVRTGFVHCGQVAAGPEAAATDELVVFADPDSPMALPPARGTTTVATTTTAAARRPTLAPSLLRPTTKLESFDGYAEWVSADLLIVDGQRIRWDRGARLRLGRITSVQAIPLGYEANVRGRRAPDGSVVAEQIEAKPNGTAAFEREVKRASDDAEAMWIREGRVSDEVRGAPLDAGEIVQAGPEIDRVRAVLNRLLPSYVGRDELRVRVVRADAWNAAVLANGAVWVYTGLLNDVSDDELAIVVGHEIAHYTHEHSRRQTRNGMLVQLVAEVANAGLQRINNTGASVAATIGASLSLSAWQSGYSRTLEDQADRVGLRYAYEAGFDVTRAPGLWRRVLERSGQLDRVSSFFWGGHSRPTERAENLERELQWNYRRR